MGWFDNWFVLDILVLSLIKGSKTRLYSMMCWSEIWLDTEGISSSDFQREFNKEPICRDVGSLRELTTDGQGIFWPNVNSFIPERGDEIMEVSLESLKSMKNCNWRPEEGLLNRSCFCGEMPFPECRLGGKPKYLSFWLILSSFFLMMPPTE